MCPFNFSEVNVLKCSECKYGIKTKSGWNCKISFNCKDDKNINHRCKGCIWATWTGLRWYCPFGRCVRLEDGKE